MQLDAAGLRGIRRVPSTVKRSPRSFPVEFGAATEEYRKPGTSFMILRFKDQPPISARNAAVAAASSGAANALP